MQEVTIITYVLDDDRHDLLLIESCLQQIEGCKYSLYTNPVEFIAAIDQGCHIAMVDFRLNATIDGLEVGRQVREKNPFCYLILLSGADDKDVLGEAMNMGFQYYIDKNKPGYTDKIISKVSSHIEAATELISEIKKQYA